MIEPLTPPECDCRGLPFMPLDVQRILDSDLFALSSGDEFKAAFSLWGKSWAQVPAASIPDDERILARFCSLSLAEWRSVAEMALRGWVKCSDGRLYHPVVAEKAREAWAARLRQRDRAVKRWQREPGEPPNDPPQPHGDAAAMPRHSDGTPAAMQGTGTERGIENPPNPPSGGADEDQAFAEAMAAYPEAGRRQTPPAAARIAWDGQRAAGAAAESLLASVRVMAASPPRSVPRFDRWLSKGVWRNYTPLTAPAPPSWRGPAEVRAAIIKRKGDAWARSWLDPSIYQDVPQRALSVPRALMRERLLDEVGDILQDAKILVFVQESAA